MSWQAYVWIYLGGAVATTFIVGIADHVGDKEIFDGEDGPPQWVICMFWPVALLVIAILVALLGPYALGAQVGKVAKSKGPTYMAEFKARRAAAKEAKAKLAKIPVAQQAEGRKMLLGELEREKR